MLQEITNGMVEIMFHQKQKISVFCFYASKFGNESDDTVDNDTGVEDGKKWLRVGRYAVLRLNLLRLQDQSLGSRGWISGEKMSYDYYRELVFRWREVFFIFWFFP